MSFLKIVDPAKREQTVKEFLAIKKNIPANELAEKTGQIELQTDLSKFFKPITETQKTTAREITKGLRPIKEGIEQLPQRLPRQKTLFFPPPPTLEREEFPPPYSLLQPTEGLEGSFHEPDTNFGFYGKAGKFFIGDKLAYLSKDREKIYIGGEEYMYTPGLYKLLAFENPSLENIPANDISMYSKILVKTNTMYVNNNPESNKLKFVSP